MLILGFKHSPGQTTELLHGRFSRRGPVHWVVKEEVAQRRERLCQPSPQVTEHGLQEAHSSVFASVIRMINSLRLGDSIP